MKKHTPGHWSAQRNVLYKGDPGQVYVYKPGYAVIAIMPLAGRPQNGIDDIDQREANANLIAASPDLKDAAEYARDKIDKCLGCTSDWVNEELRSALVGLKDAIAKAEGK